MPPCGAPPCPVKLISITAKRISPGAKIKKPDYPYPGNPAVPVLNRDPWLSVPRSLGVWLYQDDHAPNRTGNALSGATLAVFEVFLHEKIIIKIFRNLYFMVLNTTKSVKSKTVLLGRKNGWKIRIIKRSTGGDELAEVISLARWLYPQCQKIFRIFDISLFTINSHLKPRHPVCGDYTLRTA